MKTLEGQLDETLLTDRLIATLSAGFGLLATMLASVGLYGVMAFVVARRRKEMGIRLALGAEPGLVIWLVMKEVLVLLAIGLAVGLPAAIGAGTLRVVAAVRHPAERPVDGDGDDGGAGDGVGGGRADPGAARQPHQPDAGAALRVNQSRLRWHLPYRAILQGSGGRQLVQLVTSASESESRFSLASLRNVFP